MKPNKRQKLCQNCEGEVDLDVIVCPFCAADLREEKPEQEHSSTSYTQGPFGPQETLRSLYPPPYPIHREEEPPQQETVTTPPVEEKGSMILPTVLFTLGVQLLLLGLFMLLFSQGGVVQLKWEARYWFFYAMASTPFLYFGYKSLSKL